MGGDWRDPLIGRDILIGAFSGVALTLLGYAQAFVPRLLGMPDTTPTVVALGAFNGTRYYIALLTAQIINSFIFPAALLFLLVLFSLIFRRKWIAVGGMGLAFFLLGMMGGEHPSIDWVFAAIYAVLIVFLLMRFGLLAMVVAQFFGYLFFFFPVTTNFSAWYAGATIFALGIGVALVAYGFYTSLAGQKLFQGNLIDD